jgi:hypothetical protein
MISPALASEAAGNSASLDAPDGAQFEHVTAAR